MELCHVPYHFKSLDYIHSWFKHNFAQVICRSCEDNLILLGKLWCDLRFALIDLFID